MATRAAVAVDEGWCSRGGARPQSYGDVQGVVEHHTRPTAAQLEAAALLDDGPWFWWASSDPEVERENLARAVDDAARWLARLDRAAETAERVDASDGFVGSYELERGDPS